jgi:hypothetical protein
MAAGYGGSALSIHAATYLADAADDMPNARVVELYERFIAWTRPPPNGKRTKYVPPLGSGHD